MWNTFLRMVSVAPILLSAWAVEMINDRVTNGDTYLMPLICAMLWWEILDRAEIT